MAYRSCFRWSVMGLLAIALLMTAGVTAQTKSQRAAIRAASNQTNMQALKREFEQDYVRSQQKIAARAKVNPSSSNFRAKGLQEIGADGTPLYYTTFSNETNEVSRTDALHSNGDLGLDLNGENMWVGVWDGGLARTSHQEFGNRVSQVDDATDQDVHPTMVLGALLAQGIKSKAMGTAPKAHAMVGDWNRDKIEVSEAAADGLLLSNHSYGIMTDRVPDWYFGAYIKVSQDWDKIMYNAPYYLMVTASGNAQRSMDNASPISGKAADGFDLLLGFTTSKNGLTIAAAETDLDNKGNLKKAEVAAYSSLGPVDDGRIKPDLAGNGTNVYTTSYTGDKDYTSSTGTSMAAPGVTGALLLLQQYYEKENGTFMHAATLKGLALHTADDVAAPGPDYKMGWGVINAKKAAQTITEEGFSSLLMEKELANGETYTLTVKATGNEPLRASISWTDPATGKVNTGNLNDPTPALVNDLDIRITKDGQTFYPWRLNPQQASSPAAKGDNKVDPFERIDIDKAEGTYTISVSHKGNLVNGNQAFSLILTGVQVTQCTGTVPTGLEVSGATTDAVQLQWDNAPDTQFELQYREMGEDQWNTQKTEENTLNLTNLVQNNDYEVRLRSICTQNIASDYSDTISFTFKGEETSLKEALPLETLSLQPQLNLSVYPNPAVNQLHINGEVSKDAQYAIVSVTGVRIKQGNLNNGGVDVSDLADGLYMLSVQDYGGMRAAKFYKN